MTVLLVGDTEAVTPLLESLRDAGVEARADGGTTSAGKGEIAALADELVRLEADLRNSPVDAVVLADGGDSALAAALVATKLLTPVAVVDDVTPGANAGLLAQLADRKLSADAGEIRAWTEALPRLSGP
jgi:hypothetical protein